MAKTKDVFWLRGFGLNIEAAEWTVDLLIQYCLVAKGSDLLITTVGEFLFVFWTIWRLANVAYCFDRG